MIERNDWNCVYVGEAGQTLEDTARNTEGIHDYLQPRSLQSQTAPSSSDTPLIGLVQKCYTLLLEWSKEELRRSSTLRDYQDKSH